jgi:methyl-accepting chemotaxis protein
MKMPVLAPGRRHVSSDSSLRRRIVLSVASTAFVLLGVLVWAASLGVSRYAMGQSDARLLDAAQRSALLIERILLEHGREVAMIATSPQFNDAARAGAREAEVLGLVGQPVGALERRFAATRTLALAPRARAFLLSLAPELDVAEALMTDEHGFNVVTTGLTSDFVQSDEEWWQQAMRDGTAPTAATYDESARQAVISVAAALREHGSGRSNGVLKVAFGLRQTDEALARASAASGIEVDLLDVDGSVIASSSNAPRMKTLSGYGGLAQARDDSIVSYESDGGRRRAAVVTVAGAPWRLVAHVDERDALAEYRAMRTTLVLGATILFAFLVWSLVRVSTLLTKRVSIPAAALAATAEAVAAGDLSVQLDIGDADDEVSRLGRATHGMLEELRRLARALGQTSQETSSMAAEITTGSAQVASTAQEMAHTSSSLSEQATRMADTIRQLSLHAGELVQVSSALTAGAATGLDRSARLQVIAQESRTRLDETGVALRTLAAEVESNATAVDAVAAASEEIRAFVTFVQKVARQSKLLALNAAMEAARAGEQGEGFAVVATEVRRLAAGAAEAASRTEALVKNVLGRMEESKLSAARTVTLAKGMLVATGNSAQSSSQLEGSVHEAQQWSVEIERSVGRSGQLVAGMTAGVEVLARGIESFAAAMEQVAAASEQQSASTEEIASAANSLAAASRRVSALVAKLRLEGAAQELVGA